MKNYVRKFDGIYYKTLAKPTTKKIAKGNAKFRRERGQLSRVVKVDNGYVAVWSYKKPNKNASAKTKKRFKDSQKRAKNLKKKR
jgi:type II secretory pathway component PulM